MEKIILYADFQEASLLLENQLAEMVAKAGYYQLIVLHYLDDFHTCEYSLPYLETETGKLIGYQIDEFLSRHHE